MLNSLNKTFVNDLFWYFSSNNSESAILCCRLEIHKIVKAWLKLSVQDFVIISLGAKFTAKLFFIQQVLLNCHRNRSTKNTFWPLAKTPRRAHVRENCCNEKLSACQHFLKSFIFKISKLQVIGTVCLNPYQLSVTAVLSFMVVLWLSTRLFVPARDKSL